MNQRPTFDITIPQPLEYDVYKPQQLSLALRDCAVEQYEPGDSVAEAFAGCGVAGLAIAALNPAHLVTITDAWPDAVNASRARAAQEGLRAMFALGDVYAALSPNSVDLLIAAPPAVPTPCPGFWALSPGMEFATNGGPTGVDVMLRAIDDAPSRLREGGRFLITVPHWCDYQTVYARLGTRFRRTTILQSLNNRLVVAPEPDLMSKLRPLDYLFDLSKKGKISLDIDANGSVVSNISVVCAYV